MKLQFYVRWCLWLWIFIVSIIGVYGYIYSLFPKVEHTDAIVLGSPRDLVVGEKDPYFISSIAQVWEPLVDVDDMGNIVPKLAESWSHSDDYRIWNFTIRKGVLFHDGTPLNADVVLRNIQRWKGMERKVSPFYTYSFSTIYPTFEGAYAMDDYTVQFIFKEPQPLLIEQMIGFNSPLFSPASFDRHTGNFTGIPSGTGPFKLKQYDLKRQVTLQRFNDYYGEKPKEETIIIKTIPSIQTRYAALQSEEIVGVLDLGSMSSTLAFDLLKDERFAISKNKSRINHMLHVNQSRKNFQNPHIMRALSDSIDRDFIMNHYFVDYAVPSHNLVNPLAFGAIEVEHRVNPLEALKQLKVLVGEEPIHCTLLIPQYSVERYAYKEIGQYLQALWKEANINVSILILDGAAHKKMLKEGKYDFSLGTHGLSSYDPLPFLSGYLGDKGNFNRLYHLGYRNPRANQLLSTTYSAKTRDLRQHLYKELQMEAFNVPPTIVLGRELNTVVYNRHKIETYEAKTYGVNLVSLERRK